MTHIVFNNRLRQLMLLALIILLGWLLLKELFIFLPGLLGGITLYILSRSLFYKLTSIKKWNKNWTAILFLFLFLIIIALPIYFSIELISPKISNLSNNQAKVMQGLRMFSDKITDLTGIKLLTPENTQSLTQKISAFIPKLLNSTASVLTNLIMMFFLLYYLLTCGSEVEKYLNKAIPLKQDNVDRLASETTLMIRANALGIPIICIVQGAFASLGYWIFDIDDWGMWGFVTGVFAFFPIVGTMIIWIPLVLYQFSLGENWMATGLAIYSIVVTGNVDYITRLGLLKKMGNVHPMITVLGVIVGLGLFGFIGLIFGPLLVSYFIILVRIYINEFTSSKEAV